MIQTNSRRMIQSGFGEIVVLVSLPLEISTRQEAAEYFNREEVYYPIEDEYESQMYTKRYKLFRRDDRWMAYHWIGFD